MNVTLSIGPLIALVAGILILIMPRLLNFIVAAYLILIGLVGIFGTEALHAHPQPSHVMLKQVRT